MRLTRWSQYPRRPRSKLLLGSAPHCSARDPVSALVPTFSTDPKLDVLQGIMTEMGI